MLDKIKLNASYFSIFAVMILLFCGCPETVSPEPKNDCRTNIGGGGTIQVVSHVSGEEGTHITPDSIYNITNNSAEILNRILKVGRCHSIVDYGHVWSKSEATPTKYNNDGQLNYHKCEWTAYGSDVNFKDESISLMKNLDENTTYYVRAYVEVENELEGIKKVLYNDHISTFTTGKTEISIMHGTSIIKSMRQVLSKNETLEITSTFYINPAPTINNLTNFKYQISGTNGIFIQNITSNQIHGAEVYKLTLSYDVSDPSLTTDFYADSKEYNLNIKFTADEGEWVFDHVLQIKSHEYLVKSGVQYYYNFEDHSLKDLIQNNNGKTNGDVIFESKQTASFCQNLLGNKLRFKETSSAPFDELFEFKIDQMELPISINFWVSHYAGNYENGRTILTLVDDDHFIQLKVEPNNTNGIKFVNINNCDNPNSIEHNDISLQKFADGSGCHMITINIPKNEDDPVEFFFDGNKSIQTATIFNQSACNKFSKIVFGYHDSNPTSRSMDGLLDNISVYERNLSSDEIKMLFENSQ